VRGIDVFGSMVCNLAMGGLNPVAVETALKYGARQIYLPTVDSANHASLTGGEIGQHGKGLVVEGGWSEYTRTRPRLHLLDERGQLTLEVQQIVKLCAEADVILNCGHVSYPEMEKVLEAARARGFRKVVVDHPFFTRLSVKEQEALVAGGAWMNYTVGEILPRWWRVSVEDFVGTIRRLGVDRVLLSSDCGQLHNPPVVEGIRLAIQLLLEEDFSEHDIRTLVHDNAARLLYE
jgi:uncharacterized protein DUF6282